MPPSLSPKRSKALIPAFLLVVVALMLFNFTLILQQTTHSNDFSNTIGNVGTLDNQNENYKISNLLNIYAHNPNKFVTSFLHCAFHSDSCHIHYHHVQKTGGSRLASRLNPVLSNPPGVKYSSKKWCCGDDMMERFYRDVNFYCNNNKFGIYEVSATNFTEVVKTCFNYNNESALDLPGNGHLQLQRRQHQNQKNELMSLMTIREPIQLTLSQIHHQCNKNFNQKSKEEKEICRQCSFQKNPDYFLSYVEQTNLVYKEIRRSLPILLDLFDNSDGDDDKSNDVNYGIDDDNIIGSSGHDNEIITKERGKKALQRRISRHNSNQIMILDQADIDSFFLLLEKHAPLGIMVPEGRGNEERTGTCNFGMSSVMMKSLKPALEIYRILTGGVLSEIVQLWVTMPWLVLRNISK